MDNISSSVVLEVLKNALEGIADGMAITVVRTSRSSVVRNGLDFSTALLNADGKLIGQGMCQPIHLGGMEPALRSILDKYQGNISPGDILINNDPYEGGSHLPDIFQYKPVFVGDTLMGFCCAMTHHTDIGGRVAGGNSSDSTEIYQEGLRIPPLKLYDQGSPNEALMRVIEKAVRVPDKVMGDLLGQVAAMEYGAEQYLQLVKNYGRETLLHYQNQLLEYTESLMRKTIRTMPDGQWQFTDYIDDDGFSNTKIVIVVSLSKKYDQIVVNFEGTSPQCTGAIQPVFATTQGMVYSAVRNVVAALGVDIPNTSGYFNPIKVLAPEGTFVNPNLPAPVAARNLGCIRVHQAVMGAFAQMLPERIYACSGGAEYLCTLSGYDRTVIPWQAWVQIEASNEFGSGGYPWRDGIDGESAGSTNIANIPSEIMEVDNPVMIEQYGMVSDMEGAGKYRGCVGMVRAYKILEDNVMVQIRSDRAKSSSYGLFGGQSPGNTQIVVERGSTTEVKESKFIDNLNTGDRLIAVLPGGGGWGLPYERDIDLVLNDVRLGKLSFERAETVYGVAIKQSGLEFWVDEQLTNENRRSIRNDYLSDSCREKQA